MAQAFDPALSALDVLLLGFDGRALPARADGSLPWRLGRWLRTQGARRPAALRLINSTTAIVDGRILACDAFGAIQDLSTTRRASRLAPSSWNYR